MYINLQALDTNVYYKCAHYHLRYVFRTISQDKLTRYINHKYLPIIITKIDTILKMVDPQAVASKKRTLTYMHANELTGRLTSKPTSLSILTTIVS